MTDLIISPEGLELANVYLTTGSIQEAATQLCVPLEKAVELLNKGEVKRYIDGVYMDMGYRNKHKLGALMDKIIESKLEEAEETEIYSNKDLIDILQLAHKMRMEEIKAEQGNGPRTQTNVQINSEKSVFGGGNYGKLMEKLMGPNDG